MAVYFDVSLLTHKVDAFIRPKKEWQDVNKYHSNNRWIPLYASMTSLSTKKLIGNVSYLWGLFRPEIVIHVRSSTYTVNFLKGLEGSVSILVAVVSPLFQYEKHKEVM